VSSEVGLPGRGIPRYANRGALYIVAAAFKAYSSEVVADASDLLHKPDRTRKRGDPSSVKPNVSARKNSAREPVETSISGRRWLAPHMATASILPTWAKVGWCCIPPS
jgi:hypothetical protein